MKSKLTGMFLQNWWLQLHKLIQFHVVPHAFNVPPLVTRQTSMLGPDSLQHIRRDRVNSYSDAFLQLIHGCG